MITRSFEVPAVQSKLLALFIFIAWSSRLHFGCHGDRRLLIQHNKKNFSALNQAKTSRMIVIKWRV